MMERRSNYRVAIVYPFFQNYRRAVFEKLAYGKRHTYAFYGDISDPHKVGLQAWQIPADVEFHHTRFIRLIGWVFWQTGLIRLSLRREIDVVIFFGNAYWPATWISAILSRWMGKRVIFWSHGLRKRETGWKGRFRLFFLRLPHAVLLYGHRAKQLLMEEAFSPEKLHVVYNSLDYDCQVACREAIRSHGSRQGRQAPFAAPERPMIICCSRLTHGRRLDLLLEAMRLLRRDGQEVNLLVIGGGPARQSLQASATQHGLPVHFFGQCYDEKILAELTMAASATVVPGPIGLNVMHSLVYGVPVISNDDYDSQGPEAEAIIPGWNGDLFRAGDPRDLARVIKKWVQRTDRQVVAARCHELVDRFYNPDFQVRVIERAVIGLPANDLFWLASENRD